MQLGSVSQQSFVRTQKIVLMSTKIKWPFLAPFTSLLHLLFTDCTPFLQPCSPEVPMFQFSLQSCRPPFSLSTIQLPTATPYNLGHRSSDLQVSHPLMALATSSMQMAPKSTITAQSIPSPKLLPGTYTCLQECETACALSICTNLFTPPRITSPFFSFKFDSTLPHELLY